MERVAIAPRDDWEQTAEQLGFRFASIDGDVYWDESAYYRFSLNAVEQEIEEPTEEIHQMCLDLVDRVVRSEAMLTRLQVPETYWDLVCNSWKNGDPHLYGRMDFSFDPQSGRAKFLEYNAQTPTSLYETAYFQWVWLDQLIERGILPGSTDQFNSLQEKLVGVLNQQMPRLGRNPLYFACCKDTEEDLGTVDYFRSCAVAAGLTTGFSYVEDIGIDEQGRFTDINDMTIPAIFMLYPLEFMFEEKFGPYLGKNDTLLYEPSWKAILSNKGILPLLWEQHKGHPNLLPSYFADQIPGDDIGHSFVHKPIFSREGANISVMENGEEVAYAEGPYDDSGFIIQKTHPLPVFAGNHTLIGSWVVGDKAAGMSIREDDSIITRDTSRFVPHVIMD
ncbi:glutathionylspermidine synthase family protein [Parendozoicomonas haliclonae]|uniref:Putative acid-amine ligase YgiC n=2 Tax=Parendozoicomonas haliclonae TaxID=1960125 RepID=A0A1X7ARN8_9GAMM|nr:glutathionylspermidine synthase family protein [Parendozoicomonas haliclonae]SMA50750.1 putative acid-amine ligase YgiC [Parendozoicomonas haliclonae]